MANRYIDKNAGDDVYKYIMELIPQTDDLNIFLQKIYMRYNMPVIVTDIAFHLIAYGGPYPCPDPLWQALITTGAAAPETVIDYYFLLLWRGLYRQNVCRRRAYRCHLGRKY